MSSKISVGGLLPLNASKKKRITRMKLTFMEVVLELPADDVLREFLMGAGLPVPEHLAWNQGLHTSKMLLEAIRTWPDLVARDALMAKLMASVALGDGAGKQAMFQIAANDAQALVGLVACDGDIHRSFWLAMKHPALFEQACEIDYLERHSTQVQQHDLNVCHQPDISESAMGNFRQAISMFYQRELRCGDGCVAYAVERSPGIFLLTVHVKDLAMLRLEFEGKQLKRRVGNPNIHMVLEYSQATGVVRTLVKGGTKYHQMLVGVFADQLLGSLVDPRRIKQPTLNLSALKNGFDVPQATHDGFVVAHVKSITVISPEKNLQIECTAMACREQHCVTHLLHQALPNDDPLIKDWQVDAARINLYYPPAPGKGRNKVVTVEITHRGRLNLHKFDSALQAQLESYLVSLGILGQGQTLHAHQAKPSRQATYQN
jgi:hypothetical protein